MSDHPNDLDHLWLPYTQMQTADAPLKVKSADGVRLTLEDGSELIDGIASWWTSVHGYNHPEIISAMAEQAKTLPHVMLGGLVNEPALKLAKRLAAITPGDLSHVFFAESGSVSVEIALKMAVQYWQNKGQKGKTKFLSFKGGYHGDTTMTMSVSDPGDMHGAFKEFVPQEIFTKLPETPEEEEALDEFLAKHGSEIAAIITEPLVQGAGGMVFHEPQTLAKIREAANKHGTLLIVDEIFTGFGRTGTMFASEQAGIVPDIMCLSKALTGGVLPLSCAITRPHVFEAFLSDDQNKAFMHGPTYMGNPLACAAANASLDLFETEPRLEQARAISEQLSEELQFCQNLRSVRDVRVKGAIGVVELKETPNHDVLKKAFVDKGCWIRPFGNIVYLTPSLTISSEDLSTLTTAIHEVLRDL
ncbi:MAG: adenosylmethionine--8-amino-7-oxononanoate transaminase [Sphingomonadales bacterium]